MEERDFPSLEQHWLKSMPVRVSLLYFVISSLYIFLSDRLLAILFPSIELYQQIQTYKGWGYVIVVAILLYIVLASEQRRLIKMYRQLVEERQQLGAAVSELGEAYREMRGLAQRCSTIEEVERRRLADELHDRVGQTLTAMNINLKILQGLLPKSPPEPLFERIREIQSLIAEATHQMRDVIADLHPPILDDFGLSEALKWLGERYQKRFELPLTVQCDELAERLPETVEIAFYRVAQGALDNALRHAQASQIHLTLRQCPPSVEMILEDDGVGFDPDLVLKSKEYPTWGVKIMCERMLAVGGQLSIESERGKGTRVIATWTKENLP